MSATDKEIELLYCRSPGWSYPKSSQIPANEWLLSKISFSSVLIMDHPRSFCASNDKEIELLGYRAPGWSHLRSCRGTCCWIITAQKPLSFFTRHGPPTMVLYGCCGDTTWYSVTFTCLLTTLLIDVYTLCVWSSSPSMRHHAYTEYRGVVRRSPKVGGLDVKANFPFKFSPYFFSHQRTRSHALRFPVKI